MLFRILSKRNVRIGLCSLVFFISLAYLWSNILVLDDYHPPGSNISQELGTFPLEEDEPMEASSDAGKMNSPSQGKKGCHLYINLDEHIMFVYKDGNLLKTYPVSGGKKNTPSPLGTWRVISKDTWGEGFGGAWMGFNVPWGKYGIHGTVYPWEIGNSNSSKGCIRMKNKDVKELYAMVPHGATVTITQSNKSFRTLKNGDIGSDVLEMQKALKKLGYYQGGSDGKFGNALKQSVLKFQKANKIYTSGTIGRQTYDTILKLLNASDV